MDWYYVINIAHLTDIIIIIIISSSSSSSIIKSSYIKIN
jgi:hypothetical protein